MSVEYTISQASRAFRDKDGITVQDVARVFHEDMAGAPGSSKMALATLLGGLPEIGDPHLSTDAPGNVLVTSRTVSDSTDDALEVILTYGFDEDEVVSFGSWLHDVDNTRALGPANEELPLRTAGPDGIMDHVAPMEVPTTVMRIEKTYGLVSDSPEALQSRVETLNSVPWPPSKPKPAGTWMCQRFQVNGPFTGIPPNLKYRALIEFAYDRRGWNPQVIHLTEQKLPVTDPVGGVGVITSDQYAMDPFTVFGFTQI